MAADAGWRMERALARGAASAGQRPVLAAAVSQTPTSAPLHDIVGTHAATACSSLAPEMRRQKWTICA